MGLVQSCLRSPKTLEFKDPFEVGGVSPSLQLESGVRNVDISKACEIQVAVACVDNVCKVEYVQGRPQAACRVEGTLLETTQLSGALMSTATTKIIQSTFMSVEGYPHSLWDLGPPSTDDEQARVQALRALDILDSVSNGRKLRIDEEADIVLGALMQMFNAITAMLVLFDDTRIIIRNAKGVMQSGEFPYRWSFCAHTLTKNRPQTLVVPDATKDVRFSENPFVHGEPHVRFYCGAPLVAASGHIIGTVCFADNKPRPDFDASKCYVMNNMAELLVRQLERYGANAGPGGLIDAETTALTRVARTIDCYEAVTGLVDISLPDGWMLMYVNEALEAFCSPWTRKELVGRPLQRLLQLEESERQHPLQELQTATAPGDNSIPAPGSAVAPPPTADAGEGRDADGNMWLKAGTPLKLPSLSEGPSGSKNGVGLEDFAGRTCSSSSTSGACCDSRYPSGTSSSGEGGRDIILREDEAADPKLIAMRGENRRQWRQQQERRPTALREAWQCYAGALRAGEEVKMGTARVLMEDGRPSTTVVRVFARSANCHVLDAAVRMPVGIPHQLGLPVSILAAGGDDATAQTLGRHDAYESGPGKVKVDASGIKEGAAVTSSEPFYCLITLSKVDEDADAVDVHESVDDQMHRVQHLRPAAALGTTGDRPSLPSKDGYNSAVSPAFMPSTPSPSTCLHPNGGLSTAAHAPTYFSSPAARPARVSNCGRPSLDNENIHASAYRKNRGAGSNAVSVRSSLKSCASPGSCNWTYGMEPILGLKLGHLLGKGGYGRVFAAWYKGQRIAAKVISNEMLKSTTCVNGVTLEALLAQEIEHPYIVRTYKCVVRSYGLGERLSTAYVSARDSSQFGASYRTPSERGGGGASYRSILPPPTPSAVSSLPGGPSNGGILPRGCSRLRCASEAGPTSDGLVDADNAGPEVMSGNTAVSANGFPKDVAAVAATAVPPPIGSGAAMPVQVTAVKQPPDVAPATVTEQTAHDDFDSFDAEGDEAAGGMIDQLVSGGSPVYGPLSAMPNTAAPSAAIHAQLLPHTGGPDWQSVAIETGAVAQSIATTHGSVSTARANVDQMAAALTVTGRTPPQVPPGENRPAELVGPTAGSVDVFSTGAATAAEAALLSRGADASSSLRRNANDTLPEGETWILQEFCGAGTLQDAIDSGRLRTEPSRLRGKPHMPYILLAAQEVASAMACVHSRGYMHGDLSAFNVLLTEPPASAEPDGIGRGWVAKVSDFGLAKHLPDPDKPCVSSAYGVITHCAPEVLKSHMQTQKADCYSFGVLLWQMFTGSRPWANMNRFQIFGVVTSATSPGLQFLPTQQPPSRYLDLTMRCLSYNPDARPTFAEICEELRLMTYEAAAAGEMVAC